MYTEKWKKFCLAEEQNLTAGMESIYLICTFNLIMIVPFSILENRIAFCAGFHFYKQLS